MRADHSGGALTENALIVKPVSIPSGGLVFGDHLTTDNLQRIGDGRHGSGNENLSQSRRPRW